MIASDYRVEVRDRWPYFHTLRQPLPPSMLELRLTATVPPRRTTRGTRDIITGGCGISAIGSLLGSHREASNSQT
jgi:hypothetical protein